MRIRVLVQRSLYDADRADDAAVLVVVGVEDQRPQRRVGIARGAGMRSITASSSSGMPSPVFAEMDRTSLAAKPEHALELLLAALGVGRGQVDLVQHRDDLEVVLDRLVTVRQGLGLDALARVDEQQCALAGRQRARDLVAEVHVPGRVDELQDVPVVFDAHVLGLDGDAALALDVHGVEVLGAHQTRVHGTGDLEDPVRQRRLAVIDVRNDGKIPNFRRIRR